MDAQGLTMTRIFGLSFAMLFIGSATQAAVITFDDLNLAPESEWHGPDPDGIVDTGPFGTPVTYGGFQSGGATFFNQYDNAYDLWSGGFAYSNQTDNVDPSFANQYSAIAGGGRGPGADNYGVVFGYGAIDPANVGDLWSLPTISLPQGESPVGVYVTNTTYAGLLMRDGDPNGFAKQFGGDSGDDPDWFKLSVYGIDAIGNPMSNFVDFYLADYRFSDNSHDYVITDWSFVDLTGLSGAASLHFNLASSDNGVWGMNTPAYFAMDDLQTAAVPEPASIVLLGGTFLAAGAWGRFRRRKLTE